MNSDKLTKTQYMKLKNSYLSKNRTMYSLYMELNEEVKITKHLFFELINQIRHEEGLGAYYK
ncbi:hypothetical protein [Methanobrevibacter sp.]|uniref:hypothetical protein n=1 Tax=Methanobrevibacter sp. TaxID=66852 RepID=UPI00388FFE2F